MGININFKADFTPIINATPKALEYIFQLILPLSLKDKERMIALMDAQKDEDIKKIQSGNAKFDTQNKILQEQITPIELVREIINDQEILNMLKCSIFAANHLDSNENNIQHENIDSTFLNRWRKEASSFSTEAVQEMWGKILAEKINNPVNNINLRVLDILKNISSDEAKKFDDLTEYIILNDRILETSKSTSLLNEMAEIGLISRIVGGLSSGGSWYSSKTTDGRIIYFIFRKDDFYWINKKELKKNDLLFLPENNLLTSSGVILYNISKKGKEYDQETFGKLLIQYSGSLPHIHCVKFNDINRIDLSQSVTYSI